MGFFTRATGAYKIDRLAGVLPKYVVTQLRAWHIMPQEQSAGRVWLAGDHQDYGVEVEEEGEQDGQMRGGGGNRRAGMDGWEYESRRMMG